MVSHTPAPWHIHHPPGMDPEIKGADGDTILYLRGDGHARTELGKANAALIVLAPDMLDQHKQTLEAVRSILVYNLLDHEARTKLQTLFDRIGHLVAKVTAHP